MRTICSHCQALVVQAKNRDGPNFCPKCCCLFEVPEGQKVSSWIYGVLVFLVVNLQFVNIL